MRYPIIAAVILLLAPLGVAAQSDALKRGKTLHDANCTACHDTNVYTRADRRIQSLDGLAHQVDRCRDNLGFEWPARDVRDLVTYLNQSFYHFEE